MEANPRAGLSLFSLLFKRVFPFLYQRIISVIVSLGVGEIMSCFGLLLVKKSWGVSDLLQNPLNREREEGKLGFLEHWIRIIQKLYLVTFFWSAKIGVECFPSKFLRSGVATWSLLEERVFHLTG